MDDKRTYKEEIAVVIKKIVDDLSVRTDLRELEEYDAEYSDDLLPCDEDEYPLGRKSILMRVPELEWASLRVSKNSLFGDTFWDFQDEGSPLYKSVAKFSWEREVDEGIMLTDPECEPLRRLLSACLYYYLPQNNILGYCRSYNSVLPMVTAFIWLAKFLYKHGFFIDGHGNGSYRDASLLTKDHIVRCVEQQSSIHVKTGIVRAIQFWQAISDAGFFPMKYRLNKHSLSKGMVTKTYKERLDSTGTYMPISLEALSIVLPYCINLLEKHSEEILYAYNLLHPIFAPKEYSEQVGFSWSETISGLCHMKSALFSVDDFYVTDGMFHKQNGVALVNEIRRHPDWPVYEDKHLPRAVTTVSSASSDYLINVAREMGCDLTTLDHETENFVKRLKLKNMLREHTDWPQFKGKYFSKNKRQLYRMPHGEILCIARDLGIDTHAVGDGTIHYDLRKVRNTFMGVFSTFRTACQIIICLVTGMRRSEFLHIKAGKAWRVPGTEDEYRLEFDVFKTDEASQGQTVVIPIPEIAYKAYKALETISEKARQYGKCDYLYVNIMVNFGQKTHPNVVNKRLVEFWEDLGIEEDIHSHMFRKTLAMFAIYQDPRNLAVIKHLFSHRSLAMTLAYIVKIPGLSDELKLAIIQHNADLLAEVLAAAKNEKIGGACGLRIKEQVKSGKLAARLNDEGRESVEQYVESLLEHGLRLLHRCPLSVICTNTHDSVVNVSPELCNCEISNCDYAVFTEASIPALEQEIRFHERWIKHSLASEDQIRFSKRKIKDCLERFAEVQGKDAVMMEFPEHYGLVA